MLADELKSIAPREGSGHTRFRLRLDVSDRRGLLTPENLREIESGWSFLRPDAMKERASAPVFIAVQ